LKELGLRDQVHFFSNEWAVRPERTADGAAMLLIDPHVHWDGPFRFYEFRMHAGGQDLCGLGFGVCHLPRRSQQRALDPHRQALQGSR
jgi:acyl-homoserine lactone acylase PvdQ